MARPKRVEITIHKDNYKPTYKNGMEYVSVGFMANTYGSASPCDNEEEVKDAILSCKTLIIKEGDNPVVKDLRNAPNLTQHTLNEFKNTFKQLKGGKTNMKTEIKKSINQYVELYDAIQEKAPSEEAAIAILREIGKDKRSKIFAEVKEDEPATEKQKSYLKDLGVEFSESVTKREASELIEQSKNC